MSFTEADLDNLSTLSRIDITVEEKPKMLADMQAILGYVSEINGINEERRTKNEERGDSVFNVVREDVVNRETGVNTEMLLHEAPATENGYIKVMQVLKQVIGTRD